MFPQHRAGPVLASAFLLFVVAGIAYAASPLDPDRAWRRAGSLHELSAILETWLDARVAYPRRDRAARIRLVTPFEAETLTGRKVRSGNRPRGLYDPGSATIFLIRPWSPANAEDASVLLHELVHHRQESARHWYCPGAQEPEAYALQQAWLAERNLSIGVNRIAVVLEAGCSPRDIHPD